MARKITINFKKCKVIVDINNNHEKKYHDENIHNIKEIMYEIFKDIDPKFHKMYYILMVLCALLELPYYCVDSSYLCGWLDVKNSAVGPYFSQI